MSEVIGGKVDCKVTNGNDFDIHEMYDGVPYTFLARGKNSVPLDPFAALHIFGWTDGGNPEDWRRHTQKRFGWNTAEFLKSGTHDKFFDRIKFESVRYKLVEVVDNSDRVEGPTMIDTKVIAGAGGKITAPPSA